MQPLPRPQDGPAPAVATWGDFARDVLYVYAFDGLTTRSWGLPLDMVRLLPPLSTPTCVAPWASLWGNGVLVSRCRHAGSLELRFPARPLGSSGAAALVAVRPGRRFGTLTAHDDEKESLPVILYIMGTEPVTRQLALEFVVSLRACGFAAAPPAEFLSQGLCIDLWGEDYAAPRVALVATHFIGPAGLEPAVAGEKRSATEVPEPPRSVASASARADGPVSDGGRAAPARADPVVGCACMECKVECCSRAWSTDRGSGERSLCECDPERHVPCGQFPLVWVAPVADGSLVIGDRDSFPDGHCTGLCLACYDSRCRGLGSRPDDLTVGTSGLELAPGQGHVDLRQDQRAASELRPRGGRRLDGNPQEPLAPAALAPESWETVPAKRKPKKVKRADGGPARGERALPRRAQDPVAFDPANNWIASSMRAASDPRGWLAGTHVVPEAPPEVPAPPWPLPRPAPLLPTGCALDLVAGSPSTISGCGVTEGGHAAGCRAHGWPIERYLVLETTSAVGAAHFAALKLHDPLEVISVRDEIPQDGGRKAKSAWSSLDARQYESMLQQPAVWRQIARVVHHVLRAMLRSDLVGTGAVGSAFPADASSLTAICPSGTVPLLGITCRHGCRRSVAVARRASAFLRDWGLPVFVRHLATSGRPTEPAVAWSPAPPEVAVFNPNIFSPRDKRTREVRLADRAWADAYGLTPLVAEVHKVGAEALGRMPSVGLCLVLKRRMYEVALSSDYARGVERGISPSLIDAGFARELSEATDRCLAEEGDRRAWHVEGGLAPRSLRDAPAPRSPVAPHPHDPAGPVAAVDGGTQRVLAARPTPVDATPLGGWARSTRDFPFGGLELAPTCSVAAWRAHLSGRLENGGADISEADYRSMMPPPCDETAPWACPTGDRLLHALDSSGRGTVPDPPGVWSGPLPRVLKLLGEIIGLPTVPPLREEGVWYPAPEPPIPAGPRWSLLRTSVGAIAGSGRAGFGAPADDWGEEPFPDALPGTPPTPPLPTRPHARARDSARGAAARAVRQRAVTFVSPGGNRFGIGGWEVTPPDWSGDDSPASSHAGAAPNRMDLPDPEPEPGSAPLAAAGVVLAPAGGSAPTEAEATYQEFLAFRRERFAQEAREAEAAEERERARVDEPGIDIGVAAWDSPPPCPWPFRPFNTLAVFDEEGEKCARARRWHASAMRFAESLGQHGFPAPYLRYRLHWAAPGPPFEALMRWNRAYGRLQISQDVNGEVGDVARSRSCQLFSGAAPQDLRVALQVFLRSSEVEDGHPDGWYRPSSFTTPEDAVAARDHPDRLRPTRRAQRRLNERDAKHGDFPPERKRRPGQGPALGE